MLCYEYSNNFKYSSNSRCINLSAVFFFTTTAPTEIYTLSLHDALPISRQRLHVPFVRAVVRVEHDGGDDARRDRKSTRLNSSHITISYAVFCLKKKNQLRRKVYKSTAAYKARIREYDFVFRITMNNL